jgi:GntR family transcriptional regulator
MTLNIADSIAELLTGEGKGPGDRLPSEAALCARYHVSRGTVREALRLLEQRGLLEVQHGRGRFVSAAGAMIERPITEFESATEMLAGRGLRPVTRVLSAEVTAPNETEAAALGLPSTAPIVRLKRVRLSKGRPLVYQLDSFPASLLEPQHVEEIGFSGSLSKWLASRGHVLSSSAASIRATVLPPSIAALSDVDSITPWLLITEHVVDTNGLSVLFSEGYHRGDAFSFHVLRHRSSSRSGSE